MRQTGSAAAVEFIGHMIGPELGIQRHLPDAVNSLHHVANVLGSRAVQLQYPCPERRVHGALGQVQRLPPAIVGSVHRGESNPGTLDSGSRVAHHVYTD